MLRALDSRLEGHGSAVGNNLRQVIHRRASVTKQCIGGGQVAVMSYGWEGDRRSGVALAMRHRLNAETPLFVVDFLWTFRSLVVL